MDEKTEYHDPDYPEAPVTVKAEKLEISEEEKIEKIKHIIHREFSNEIQERENEVTLIDQRLLTARRYLHQLRYTLVNKYYNDQRLQLSSSQISDDIAAQTEPRAKTEVAQLLRDGQRRLHPSVRKLLGKKTADLDEIFRFRGPRNKTRKDYSAMVQKRNYTISADSTKTLRPEGQEPKESVPEASAVSAKPKKIPRHIEPKVENVLTLDEITRNKMKHRYRIVIGNTSKYVPPSSRIDKSTHKWLLYVRGPPLKPDLSCIITSITARLHHSYAPHHNVHLRKPPFQISRRGWGEFPVKLELHFALPEVNRPSIVSHTIKLDRHYTGLQTLGGETIVDIYLYSTPDMLELAYKEEEETNPQSAEDTPHADATPQTEASELTDTEVKQEQNEPEQNGNDSWMEFFDNQTSVSVDDMIVKNVQDERLHIPPEPDVIVPKEETNLDVPISDVEQPWRKRIMKYMDPTTGKIYYLEMDRALDLSKVKEIVINSKGNVQTATISPIKSNGLKKVRKGVSLLKPGLKNSQQTDVALDHIMNDHCYLGYNCYESQTNTQLNDFQKVIPRFRNVRQSVNYLLKKIPLISGDVQNSEFVKCFPFVVENDEKYWKLDFAKRRNIEWSRAKLIKDLITANFTGSTEPLWRTKQILCFARLHGYYPIRPENVHSPPNKQTDEWSSWHDADKTTNLESNIRELYPTAADITSRSTFDIDRYKVTDEVVLSDSDEEVIDVTGDRKATAKAVSESKDSLNVLPSETEDKLRFLFVERKCADIGLELRNEDVGHGYCYSAVHAVLLSAMKSFAEELIRDSLAVKLMEGSSVHHPPPTWCGSSSRVSVQLEHVFRAASRLPFIANTALGTKPKQTHTL
ncbi:unnamed protein product [Leptosia nina]|uniref:YEATS domain-containing protein n=1 Tax=Leptosia nina TaxID=320188 RepID=A0AAV1JIN2_9NEOP